MEALKRTVIIDVDGTLYDNFSRDDKIIISKIIKKNILVKLLDKFLWAINSLDIISNSMNMLRLRLRIYSILLLKDYDQVRYEYSSKYEYLLRMDLCEKEEMLKRLSKVFNIKLITNNYYATSVLYRKFRYQVIYCPTRASRIERIKEIASKRTISYIIGNNYMDDICLAHKLKTSSVYVGNSIFKKRFKATYNVQSVKEVLEILDSSS